MASSAAAAVKKALLVAVCVNMLLLHPSMGRHSTSPYTGRQPPPPASPHCHYTGHHPPPPPPTPVVAAPPTPTPTPVPAPVPTPTTPAPAPSPTNCNYSGCVSQCSRMCQANGAAGVAMCESDVVTQFNVCYVMCTSRVCAGDSSCVNSTSGCGYGHCPCDDANGTTCCQLCRSAVWNAVYPRYQSCRNYYDKAVGHCMADCHDTCFKNCTQLGA